MKWIIHDKSRGVAYGPYRTAEEAEKRARELMLSNWSLVEVVAS